MRNIMRNNFVVAPVVIFLLVATLHGCTIGSVEKDAPRTYLLNPEIPAKTFSANPKRTDPLILLINQPMAQAGFETARMAYLLRPHEVSYYAFNQWADTPARMFAVLLTQTMERTGLWHAVVQAPSAVKADYRLDCDNLALEQQFFSRPSRMRVAIRVLLIDHKRQNIVGTRTFEIFQAAPSEDAYGGVLAANRAATQLLEQVAEWVRQFMHEINQGASLPLLGRQPALRNAFVLPRKHAGDLQLMSISPGSREQLGMTYLGK
jgi:cholesterol transport system auxiliary component